MPVTTVVEFVFLIGTVTSVAPVTFGTEIAVPSVTLDADVVVDLTPVTDVVVDLTPVTDVVVD